MYLHTKFQVSSITLTSFKQDGGEVFYPPPPPSTSNRTPKKPTQIRVKDLFLTIDKSALKRISINRLKVAGPYDKVFEHAQYQLLYKTTCSSFIHVTEKKFN